MITVSCFCLVTVQLELTWYCSALTLDQEVRAEAPKPISRDIVSFRVLQIRYLRGSRAVWGRALYLMVRRVRVFKFVHC